MEAIILAGGKGTRLQTIISEVPKPMAPIHGKPFLAYLLDLGHKQGITHFILAIGYQHEKISDYFGCSYLGIPITYSLETTPLGTGGAVIAALQKVQSESVFIFNGDTFFNIDLAEIYAFHKNISAGVTIALSQMKENTRYGAVSLDKNQIISFSEKKSIDNTLINGGIYLINTDIFKSLILPKSFSLEKDFFEVYVSKINMYGLVSEGYFLDIGIPTDYSRALIELEEFILKDE